MMNEAAFWPQKIVDYGITQAMVEQPVIIGGPEISRVELMAASDSIARIITLLASLPDRTGKSLNETAQWLGFTPQEADILTLGCDALDPQPYARADVIRTGKGIKLVEINVGAVVGGAMEGSLPWLSGSFQPHNPISKWIDYLGRIVPRGGRGILIYDGPEGSDWNAHIKIMASRIREILNIDVTAARRPVLNWDGEYLHDVKGVIDWIYPIYFPWQVTMDPDYYQPIFQAIRQRAVALPVHPSTLLLASKKMFAWLWQCLNEGLLSTDETALVKAIIPDTRTLSVDTLDYASQQQQSLVLKPSNGHCGLGVVIGHEVTPQKWRQELECALKDDDDDYLLQECCEPVLEKTVTVDHSGVRDTYLGRYIWGMFVAEGEFCGTPFMRCRSPDGSLVINCANGAACGPLSRNSSLW